MACSGEATSRYAAVARLRDGDRIRIRAIRPDDRERLLEHFRSLSRVSVYRRFLCVKSRLSEDEVRRLTTLDFDGHVGLVAIAVLEGRETILGVARYVVLEGTSPRRAELAVAVRDDAQERGIGTALLEHLLQIAVAKGVRHFEADILDENEPVLRMIQQSGLAFSRIRAQGVEHVLLSIEGH
jgi:GNAT superfamily N-acetyltransferase